MMIARRQGRTVDSIDLLLRRTVAAPHRPWGQHVAFMFQAEGYRDWEVAHRQGKLDEVQNRFWGTKPFEELYDTDAAPPSGRESGRAG